MMAFYYCDSLQRIALPLKDGMMNANDTFVGCVNSTYIDLAGGVHETIAALLMEE